MFFARNDLRLPGEAPAVSEEADPDVLRGSTRDHVAPLIIYQGTLLCRSRDGSRDWLFTDLNSGQPRRGSGPRGSFTFGNWGSYYVAAGLL